MSSKRGRKRNDTLPPNRARDVQRAFRARRAAHLQALEERVAELEEENETLRTALNLPPANRPSLGRGPTGKDRTRHISGSSTFSNADEGSASPPTSSSSQQSLSLAMSSAPHPSDVNSASSSWENALALKPKDEYMDRDEHAILGQGISSSSYGYESANLHFNNAVASSSRSPMSGSVYMSSAPPTNQTHSPGRPRTSSSSFSQEEHMSYTTSPLPFSHGPSTPLHHPHSPSPAVPIGQHHIVGGSLSGGDSSLPHNHPHTNQAPHLQLQEQAHQSHHSYSTPQNMSYSVRRSLTESHPYPAYFNAFPPTSYSQQQPRAQASPPQPSIRISVAPPRLPPNHIQQSPSCPGYSGPEGAPQSSSHRVT